ncbi:LPXTG cell wall anchor domain-containing protein [Enterococcus sp.]|uniref:LPXTG cell wall anchor domain-containing protein n=1 Tax=Enterococcus sp. TaxID=35783 RepID=UPI0028A6BBB1|nr:LPXTG cell wall anchor domain-containing protein [Enterococcus sp.]
MKKTKKFYLKYLYLMLALAIVWIPRLANAAQIQSAETESTLSFTGIYVPIGTPNPTPPDGIEKPSEDKDSITGALPKTNEQRNIALFWFGILLITINITVMKNKLNVGGMTKSNGRDTHRKVNSI